jgi:hypothetical protein
MCTVHSCQGSVILSYFLSNCKEMPFTRMRI